uniref:Microsomal glutathione S-transferase 1 n=1 Tax=Clastoptera arizonana TaxID=38151 RepID=A0A1B6D184_9HEMI
MMNTNLLSKGNPVMEGFALYAGILILKTLLMSFLTAIQRFRKKAFANPEDATLSEGGQVKTDDQDVERVRRAHQNDLENIIPFLITGFLFVLSDPDLVFALMLFRIFTIARILHTLVYAIYVVRQPARVLCFAVGIIVNIIMIVFIFINFHQF